KYVRAGWKLKVIPRPPWAEEVLNPAPAERAAAPSANGLLSPPPPHEAPRSLAMEELVRLMRERPERANEMHQALQHLVLKGFAPRVVLDIGSAKGWWSMIAGWYFKQARFYMIDPLTDSEENLKQICEQDARFRYLLMAVGSTPGEVTMNVGLEP